MKSTDVADLFYLRTGAEHPFWTFTDDSNVIRLGDSPRTDAVASELDRDQAQRVRAIGDAISRVDCTMNLSGETINFYLFGKRLTDRTWRGIASANPAFVVTRAMAASLEGSVQAKVIPFPFRRVSSL